MPRDGSPPWLRRQATAARAAGARGMIRGIQLAWGQRLKTIAAIWGRSCRWAASLFGRRYRLAMVEGRFPTKLNRQRLYVLTEDGLPWEAAMICPCGCGATLHMNLLADERPRWH